MGSISCGAPRPIMFSPNEFRTRDPTFMKLGMKFVPLRAP
jgi:hypothetical protein